MAEVASKNMFDLLGNDVEDENETPKAPPREIVKKTTSSKKADVVPSRASAPVDNGRGSTGRRPRGDGNEGAFRDRGNGRESNRSRPTDESGGPRDRGGRGGRGGKTRGRQFDRHSATDRVDSDKQVSQGWGSNKGNNEWRDEQAGENIAQAEATDDATGGAAAEGETQLEGAGEAAAEPEPEPEDKTKSFAQWQAELEARSPIAELPEARRANEGARENKQWTSARELVKDEDEEYFSGSKLKQKSQKQRKEKNTVEIDHGFVDPRSLRRTSGDRGGRGGRGGGRGDRPPRARGEYRGGRGGGGVSRGLNVADESAFPTLGSK